MRMLYKLLILSCFVQINQIQAKVITVSNRDGDIAQHKTIASALNEAVDGDIIYVSGSSTPYGDFTVDKRLTFIGTGHNPENEDPLISQLGTVRMEEGSSGSEIIGFRIAQIFVPMGDAVNNLKIQRNRIIGQSQVSISLGNNTRNWTIQENIVQAAINSTNSNENFEQLHRFKNNIIQSTVLNVRYSQFTNNIFISPLGIFSSSLNNTFTNNIFFQNNLNQTFSIGFQNCNFNNNIFFGPNNPSSLPTGNNNTGVNNIFSNPLFVNVPNNTFSYDFDYKLQAGSPGINTGTDSTDIGLFGGIKYSVSGEPAIPQVTLFNIINPNIPQNGNLNVRLEGRANN